MLSLIRVTDAWLSCLGFRFSCWELMCYVPSIWSFSVSVYVLYIKTTICEYSWHVVPEDCSENNEVTQ